MLGFLSELCHHIMKLITEVFFFLEPIGFGKLGQLSPQLMPTMFLNG